MKEMEFICKACGSKRYRIREVPNGTGTARGWYCADCGRWHKWLTRAEAAVLSRQEAAGPAVQDPKPDPRREGALEVIGKVRAYLTAIAEEWLRMEEPRKHELANVQVYNHVRKELDDLDRLAAGYGLEEKRCHQTRN